MTHSVLPPKPQHFPAFKKSGPFWVLQHYVHVWWGCAIDHECVAICCNVHPPQFGVFCSHTMGWMVPSRSRLFAPRSTQPDAQFW